MARNQSLFYKACKRAFDIAFGTVATVLCALPCAVACVAIAVESGGAPVYAQARIGQAGKVISVYKLRTMVRDADDVARYLSSEQMEQWKRERKVDNDPRITRVGRFLRAISLDEVPQFVNVVRGDMSVVGPRPITRDELTQHFTEEERAELLSVPCGITGLWQTGRRNEATFETGERQAIELEYVRSAGFATDARIIGATFGAMFGKGRNGR